MPSLRILSRAVVGFGLVLAGLLLLKVTAVYDVYTTPLMTLREMWLNLPSSLRLSLAGGYLSVLSGCALLLWFLANRWRKKPV
jgi:hypothetical protein